MKQNVRYRRLIVIPADFIPEPSLHKPLVAAEGRVIGVCLVAAEPPHYFVVSG